MAVLGRVLLSSGERVDLADFLSIDSYTAGDLQQLLTGFVGSSTPYILQGFDVIDPASAIGHQSCSINVASAGVFYPGSTTGPFFFGLADATPQIPSLVPNTTNYIYLTLTTTNTAQDTRAFWDPDVNSEFTQEVNTESVIEAQINVSTGSFPTGTVPVAIVVMTSTITSIEDARPLMFRLGTGGIAPDPSNTFPWPNLPSPTYAREEPPTTITAGGVNPFQGADKNIQTLKQWMDAVMTKLKELGGTTYWYEQAVPSGEPIKIALYDPVDINLPTGLVTIDGVSVTAGMLVLFSALTTGNNQIYQANGTGTSITSWTVQSHIFNNNATPTAGDEVIVLGGQAFANQVGEFNGTTWLFNNTVRYFNGTDYWEQSSIITTTLNDNTTNGTVFSVNHNGSENMIIDYSIVRGGVKETSSLYITTDGTNVSVTAGGTTLNGPDGVTFSGIISGVNLILQYTTTSTGTSATIKYSIKRWSDGAGGPGGAPSYSGFSPSGGAASGPNESIQFNNVGSLAGSSNFLIDTTNGLINLNGLQQTILSSGLTVVDNTAAPSTLFSYPAVNNFAIIEYSIMRHGSFRVGRMLVANDGAIASATDDETDTNNTGVQLSAIVSGSNVAVQYTSSSTGFNGTLKYSMRRWS